MTRVGITGHQNLRTPEDWAWVKSALRDRLLQVSPPIIGVSSLAIGTDQLFARLVCELGGTLHVVVPFAEIERSFDKMGYKAFQELSVNAVTETIPPMATDEESYLAAGIRVVDLSDRVFAVWDGRPAKGKGGTGDIVLYARRQMKPLTILNPRLATVTEINS
jgi:hypothetical protein